MEYGASRQGKSTDEAQAARYEARGTRLGSGRMAWSVRAPSWMAVRRP